MSAVIVEPPQQAPASVLLNSVVKNLASLAARAWAKRWKARSVTFQRFERS